MNRLQLMIRSSKLLRDESNTIYSKLFIYENINEGIDRFKQLVPELGGMLQLNDDTTEVILLPAEYQHLLSIYAIARCYEIDERHYEANKYMNEFEIKVGTLKDAIASGEITIKDPSTGEPVVVLINQDYVVNVYYKQRAVEDETVPVM